jgi:hypothetical protein
MFSPENTTLTTVGLEQNLDRVAVTYVDTQPNAGFSYDPNKGWLQTAGSGSSGAATYTTAREVILTAVKDVPSVIVSGNKITGYYTDCFDNQIKYRTKDDQFVTTKKWKDIALAIANNTFSELYYYKADTRTRIIYDYVASVSPSPLTMTYLNVAFVNGVATVSLTDANGLFVGGADKTYDYATILSNCRVIVTSGGTCKYTEKLEIEFAPSENYNAGAGVYGKNNSGQINVGSNSFTNNPGRKIVTSSDGKTLTFTLDLSNTTLYGDGSMSVGTFYAAISANYVTGQTYHINVDNDWNSGRNQLIKYTNLTKYQKDYLVQWINSNSDKVTWINNVLEAVDWENSNL